MAPIGKIVKKYLNCHIFTCVLGRVVIFGYEVWFSRSANSVVSFKFTPDRPLLPW